jgi:PTH1 family peptidyl-tRNA hydrolase
MNYIIVGLGNPGEEYAQTRHNAGRIIADHIRTELDLPEWKTDKKLLAEVSKGSLGKHTLTLVCPNTFMNKSGVSVKPLITNAKSAERLLVIYDDLDIGFGDTKMSFNKSSGGHKGVESIIKAIKTEAFGRIRIGISPVGSKGIKKPKGEEMVTKLIMGKFSSDELKSLKKISKKICETADVWSQKGVINAMTFFNTK